MKITSAFTDGGTIPEKYSMYGENRIPPIHFDEVPSKARSLALIVDDPDAPQGTFTHWLLFNVDPKIKDRAFRRRMVWGIVPLYFALLLSELTSAKASF